MGYVKYLRQYVGHEPILTAGVGLLVFNEREEVLMQLRADYNQYGFPGGAMELGESFEQTAFRELREETNLEIVDLKMLKIVSGKDTYREYPNGDKLYDITAIYVVTKYNGELMINDNESKKLSWFSIDKIPDNINEHTRNDLEKFGNLLKEALEVYRNNRD